MVGSCQSSGARATGFDPTSPDGPGSLFTSCYSAIDFSVSTLRSRLPVRGRRAAVPLHQLVLPRRLHHLTTANQHVLCPGRELERVAAPHDDVRVAPGL